MAVGQISVLEGGSPDTWSLTTDMRATSNVMNHVDSNRTEECTAGAHARLTSLHDGDNEQKGSSCF